MIVAVTMVKDEQDIIAYTLAHLLAEGVDRIIVADNMSTDDTRQILDVYAELHPVTIIDDFDPGYYQNAKMTRLAQYAAEEFDADWVLPFDADELFYDNDYTLGEFFDRCPADIVKISGWDHIATDEDDPTDPNPFTRIRRRRQSPQKFGSVAFRPHPDAHLDFGNHFVLDHPGRPVQALHYRHFAYRSFEQMVSKGRNGAAAYAATDLSPMYGTHWRNLGQLGDTAIHHQWRALCEEPGLIIDPAPWRTP